MSASDVTLAASSRSLIEARLAPPVPRSSCLFRRFATHLMNVNDARLLPRYRGDQVDVLEHRQRARVQARVLLDEMDRDQHGTLREALTKPGDPIAVRGIPAVGSGVGGVVRGTDPFAETARREAEAQSLRERTAA